MGAIEDQIRRKGLELGFSNVGFAEVRDYPDHLPALREARANTDNPDVLRAIDWAIAKLETL